MDIIKKIKKRQIKEGLSDTKFAKKLGISRQMWEAILKGKRQAGYKVLSAIIDTYPDLTDSVLLLVDNKVLHKHIAIPVGVEPEHGNTSKKSNSEQVAGSTPTIPNKGGG